MQISQDAINYGDPQQQPYAGQTGQFFEELMEILVKVAPPHDEVLHHEEAHSSKINHTSFSTPLPFAV